MKKNILLLLIGIFPLSIFCQKNNLEQVLTTLDQTLNQRNEYALLKESRIQQLKEKKQLVVSLSDKYALNEQIINEYATYLCDSAITYAEKNREIANSRNDEKLKTESTIQLAKMYALGGLFFESSNLLKTINSENLSKNLQSQYYYAYYRFYDTLIKYINDDKYNNKYAAVMVECLDSAQILNSNHTQSKNVEMIYKDFLDRKYRLAIEELSAIVPDIDPQSHTYAIATSCLAYAYMAIDENSSAQKEYLARAAATDARLATKDHSALLNLAILLYNDGDIDRAYRYIKIALDDANTFNSRHRNIAISKILPLIEKTYQDKIDHQKNRLTLYLTLVSILVVGLLFTCLCIYKQVLMVTKARRNLKLLNMKLDEANHIKEEYIGYFLNQCSVYINKLDEYKQSIHRKIKAGRLDDLTQMIASKTGAKKDIQDLYLNFDTAFLKLYPSFVEEFNTLLKESERYKLKLNELNTELRIFALIRLGITDNKQISSFLRYSVQTIYNYRSKVKAKAKINDNLFEEKVKNIGIL